MEIIFCLIILAVLIGVVGVQHEDIRRQDARRTNRPFKKSN